MKQARLKKTSLMILFSEYDVLQSLDINETLQKFAKEKAKKKFEKIK